MIWRLLRREPLLLPAFSSLLAVLWALALPGGDDFPIAAAVFPILLLFVSTAGRRATLFEAALPIPSRSLFVVRLLFLLLAVWTPILTAAAFLAARGRGVSNIPALVAAGMTVTAAAVVALTSRIEEVSARIPKSGLVVVGAIGLGMAQALAAHALLIAAICAAGAAARLAQVWPRIPAAFQAASVEPAAAAAVSRARTLPNASILPLVRSVFPRLAAAMAAIVVFQSAIGMWQYGIVAGVGIPGFGRRASRWLWGLPISRRALLWLTAGPYLACLAGGLLLGAWLRPMRVEPAYPISVDDNARTPVECWRIGRGAVAPTRAPWGETVEPRTIRMPGFVLYNPYTVRHGNSAAFADWQFQRATEAIYGTPMTSVEYGKADRGALRPMSERLRPVALTAAIVLALALLGIFAGGASEWRPLTALPKKLRTVAIVAILVVAFLPVLGMEFRAFGTQTQMNTAALVSAMALRLSAALPDGPWASLGVAVVIVGAGWLLVERQWTTMEPGRVPETMMIRLEK